MTDTNHRVELFKKLAHICHENGILRLNETSELHFRIKSIWRQPDRFHIAACKPSEEFRAVETLIKTQAIPGEVFSTLTTVLKGNNPSWVLTEMGEFWVGIEWFEVNNFIYPI